MTRSELRQITSKTMGKRLRYVGNYAPFKGQIVETKQGEIKAMGVIFWDAVIRGPKGVLLNCNAADLEPVAQSAEAEEIEQGSLAA
jgi:hypothetical protein